MKPLIPIIYVFSLLLISCSNQNNKIEQRVEDYISVYSERKNAEQFYSFYDENVLFMDMVSGKKITNLKELKSFFDWKNPTFELLEDSTFHIDKTIIQNNQASIIGYFNRFKWGNSEFERMHFTTILTFNSNGKIIKQIDWINYPSSLLDYNTRKNSNDWIR